MLKEDAAWPRAAAWLQVDAGAKADLALLGVPANLTSISATGAHATPDAIRQALLRYSLQSSAGSIESISAIDAGNIEDPDHNEAVTIAKVTELTTRTDLVVALGGDNSVTYATALGAFGTNLETSGLITFDAHHDIRHGVSNGSPVRRLIEAGLNPKRIVQIGINDFSNSPAYANDAAQLGIHVIHRDELETRALADVMAEAFAVAGAGGGPIHVDIDVDVCDRAFVPACPAAAPGGITAYQLRKLARLAAEHPRVKSIDVTEIDATADSADGRTIRLGALLVLEAAAGLLERRLSRADA
jgi:formiminoglutamase